ncbi:GTP-binding protein At3g49725, chloroplastic isoform X2 [Manihot esculenta]|uniref:GTP-binding protein At3g49725, chloroplastic isoform X2 n=1 Tax=Manihot esculenta TaxID=3983 RepID=UPI001CC7FCFE|nr:GTP-binding protein At3g49725, chloroplastic isoform X2 [Manihot esculenta]
MSALSALRYRFNSLTQTLTAINQSLNPHTQSSILVPISILSSHYSSKQQSNDRNEDKNDVVSLFNRDPTSPPRLFVVQPRLRPDTFLQAKLNEALCLANSLEEQREGYFETDFFDKALPPHVVVQNPILRSSRARADTYFGPGTVETIKCHLYASESKGEVDAVFVNSILSGVQQRNLERAWGKPVLDRVGLIIEIFNAHAHTKEAKLQSELAALIYKKSRLVRVRGPDGRHTFGTTGEAEVVSARGRGSGGRGFISGAGETELQLQRRRILERRNHLLSQIEEVRRTRALQRAARKRHGGFQNKGLATVAVVGYTNALVEAFHATLEEVVEADLLVHVIDCTAPNLEEHRTTVLQVLQQIGVSEEKLRSMIEVWNKIDYEEGEMGADDSVDDGGASSWPVDEDDNASEVSSELEDDRGNSNSSLVMESSKEDYEETIENMQENYSDGWLLSEDDQEKVGDHWLKSLDEQRGETLNNLGIELQSQAAQHGPHVKISAITGVGLQELLELIDEKLKTQDETLKAQNVVERGFFDRKWRPSRTDDAGMAVEQ